MLYAVLDATLNYSDLRWFLRCPFSSFYISYFYVPCNSNQTTENHILQNAKLRPYVKHTVKNMIVFFGTMPWTHFKVLLILIGPISLSDDQLNMENICMNQSLLIALLIFWLIFQIGLMFSCCFVIQKYKRLAMLDDERRKIHESLEYLEGRRVHWADQGGYTL